MKAFVVFASLLSAACVREITPPPPPERAMPPLPVALPEARPGTARVVISTDVPARVGLRDAYGNELPHRGGGASAGRLCAETPCVAMLPPGQYALDFWGIRDGGRSSSAWLTVMHDTEVINHTLGQGRASVGQPIGIGLMGVGAALVTWAVISLAATADQSHRDSSQEKGLALGGLGALAIGGVVLGLSPTTRQPGSTTEWSPQPGR